MKNYQFQETFHALYDKAVGLYAKGERGADTFFTADEKAFLTANGLTAQSIYDYAEDHNNYGEPGYDIALGIEFVRRDYFLQTQHGKLPKAVLDETKLPAKTDAVHGIEWLPRIIPKAKAKLHGELPATLMYCCGGDRKFFKAHDINPVEFLEVIQHNAQNDNAIVDWVIERSASAKTAIA
jgi:hypothetical protein